MFELNFSGTRLRVETFLRRPGPGLVLLCSLQKIQQGNQDKIMNFGPFGGVGPGDFGILVWVQLDECLGLTWLGFVVLNFYNLIILFWETTKITFQSPANRLLRLINVF